MPVCELLSRVSSSELTEWYAYYSLANEPPQQQQTPAEARAVLKAMAKKKAR